MLLYAPPVSSTELRQCQLDYGDFNSWVKNPLNSTLLHSFVIFPVSETIFGMSGCFPVSQGQEMKDLTASSGRKATRGCQCSFSAQVRLKNSHEYKKLFLSLVK